MPIKNTIEQIVKKEFTPSFLEIRDDSHLHAGHTGNPDGKGETHFHVTIISSHFEGKSKVTQQREVYDVLKHLMPSPIHALSLKTGHVIDK